MPLTSALSELSVVEVKGALTTGNGAVKMGATQSGLGEGF